MHRGRPRNPDTWIHWQPIAEIGVAGRCMEIAFEQRGKYRVLYWMFPKGHQAFDVEPNKESLLARVEKELGHVARMMVEEALRLRAVAPGAAELMRSGTAHASEALDGTGACPI
jgi:hypothetical protein